MPLLGSPFLLLSQLRLLEIRLLESHFPDETRMMVKRKTLLANEGKLECIRGGVLVRYGMNDLA